MISTSHTALSNKGSNTNLQTYPAPKSGQAVDETVANSRTNNTSTYAGSGVILTLSKQAILSSAVRTLASTSNSSILKVGSKGTEVTELQKNLTKLGYDTKGTDGIFGNDTKNAVLSFQRAHNLTADGIVGAGTQSAIVKALNYHDQGILVLGSRGAAVTELQKNLTKLGYDTKGTEGIFGEGTKNAVIAFQKDHGLGQDGMVGNDTKNAINNALKNIGSSTTNPTESTVSIQKMLDNLKNDTSLGISADKKTAILKAAERLLNDKYEPAFVAGVLGNIQNEGTPGIFESSAYKTESKKPEYLKYMDNHFDYRNKFSGKSIQEVGIAAAIDLQNKAKESGYAGKFGLGMIQWTGSRTEGVLASYQKYATSDKPTKEECIMAEVNFIADELSGEHAPVYSKWKNGDRSASSAGEIVCKQYERPSDMDNQAGIRAQNADKIYAVMIK